MHKNFYLLLQDVQRISADLKNIKLMYKLPGSYSHMDFLYGRDTNKIILGIVEKLFSEN